MIRSLRRRHRIMFLILVLLLPLGFALGLYLREPPQVMDALPEELLNIKVNQTN